MIFFVNMLYIKDRSKTYKVLLTNIRTNRHYRFLPNQCNKDNINKTNSYLPAGQADRLTECRCRRNEAMTTQNTHQLTNDIQRNSVLNTRYELTVPEYLCKAHIYNSTGYELTAVMYVANFYGLGFGLRIYGLNIYGLNIYGLGIYGLGIDGLGLEGLTLSLIDSSQERRKI